jgi:hypothetical protein
MEDAQIAHILEELDTTERYISVAKEYVAHQRARIAMGRVGPFSTELLRAFEDALCSFRSHRDMLKHELSLKARERRSELMW